MLDALIEKPLGAAAWLADAVALWSERGVDPATGGFREGLNQDATPHDPFRRARVQARQAFVLATLAEGPGDPRLAIARRGMTLFLDRARRPDGLYATRLACDGTVLDAEAWLYDQDFVLLALSALAAADPADTASRATAQALWSALNRLRAPAGGFRETGARPFQANAHMHLLEAALAWETADPSGRWQTLSDEVVALAMARFIDPGTGLLSEFFDAEWRPLAGDDALLEPGHHFEWAWLLSVWAGRRGDAAAAHAARRLYDLGRHGVDTNRSVVVNALWPDFSVRDATARLWPQTEFLRAAVAFREPDDLAVAAKGLSRYLATPVRGLWRDKLKADGTFLDEPAPATSLYHLLGAVQALGR